MFDFNQAVSEWRQRMTSGGIKAADVLNELESHLREDVDEQIRSGLSQQQAFYAAVQRIGESKALKREFRKVNRRSIIKLKILAAISGFIACLLGVATYPLYHLTSGMYAISGPDGSILYHFSTSKGWFIFGADVMAALLLVWATYVFLKRSSRKTVG